MQPFGNTVQIGNYILNIEQKVLSVEGEEVPAELKSIELLIYLQSQYGRYVSLNELHEHVWTGRVVSDTAVRNCIKKLRNVLNDNNLEDPQYIKSVPKRGYKLICEITPVEPLANTVSVNNTSTSTSSLTSNSSAVNIEPSAQMPGENSATAAPANQPRRRQFIAAFMFLCVVVSVYAIWGYSASTNTTQGMILNTEQVLSKFPGEKTSMDVSSDGKVIIFTGRTEISQNSQLYIYNLATDVITQLTNIDGLIWNARFVESDEAVFFDVTKEAKTSLHRLSIKDLLAGSSDTTRLPVTIPISAAIMQRGRASRAIDNERVLMPISLSGGLGPHIHSVNTVTGKIKRVTSTPNAHEFDYLVDVSPEQNQFVIARRQLENSYAIIVFDIASKQELTRFLFQTEIETLSWASPNKIVVSTSDDVIAIDLDLGIQSDPVVTHAGRLIDLVAVNDRLFFLKNDKAFSERFFVETSSLEIGESKRDILSVDGSYKSLHYTYESDLFLVVYRDSYNQLNIGAYDRTKKQLNPVISGDSSSNEDLQILSTSPTQPLALIKSKGQILLVNFKSRQLQIVTPGHRLTSDAVFANKGQAVLFGEKVSGQWQINQVQVDDLQEQQLVVKGIRTVRESELGLIGADSSGQLFTIDEGQKHPVATLQRICYAHICDWDVQGNNIIFSSFDSQKSIYTRFDLSSNKETTFSERRLKMYPRFSVSHDTDKILYASIRLQNTNIVSLSSD